MCGASIPEHLRSALDKIKDDNDQVVKFGIEFSVEQARDLIQRGAPGLHLYTLNKSKQVEGIINALGNWR
jgi:methylenetetrahydrofolate reductase (NADPH)